MRPRSFPSHSEAHGFLRLMPAILDTSSYCYLIVTYMISDITGC